MLASNAVHLFGRCLESLHNVVYKFLQEKDYKFIKIVVRGWIVLLYSDATPDIGAFRLNIDWIFAVIISIWLSEIVILSRTVIISAFPQRFSLH